MKLALKLLASVTAAFLTGFCLIVWANPEVRFWRTIAEFRERDLAALRAAHPGEPVILFAGGSSTAFSIDPAIIERQCGLPAFNLGLPAGTGPRYILGQAFAAARPGDYLVVGLEPDFLSDETEYPVNTLATALAIRDGNPAAATGGPAFGDRLGFREILSHARPDAVFMVTLAYRTATGTGYRYQPDDYRPGGRLETDVANPDLIPKDAPVPRRLSAHGRELLTRISQIAAARDIRVFYTLPWQFTSPAGADASRRSNAEFLANVETILPVLADPAAGVATARETFADSQLHLTAAGSAARSEAVARALAEVIHPR